MISDPPIANRFYRHYKGGLYFVAGFARVFTTRARHPGAPTKEVVDYYHVSGSKHRRDLDDWLSEIDGKPDVKRFELLPADFRFDPR